MTANFIYIKGKRYNKYDTYNTYKEALKVGTWQHKKTKSQYFILITESGFPLVRKRYVLYLTRVVRFGF